MIRGIASCSLVLLLGTAAASAQSLYNPQAKFADVFGRDVIVMKDGKRVAAPTLADASAAGGVAGAAVAALSSTTGPMTCNDMMSLKLPWVTMHSAKEIPAANGLPAYCQVIGVVDQEINFEVDLPANWNGKFAMGGGGGFLGTLGNDIQKPALTKGYATGATDTGHIQPDDAGGSWALHNPERLVNWGHRGTHVAAATSKLVIQAFYHKRVTRSYYAGSSGSGRVAMMEAERYPKDFDGILAACPALSWTKLNVLTTAWTQKNMYPTAADEYSFHPVIAPAKVPLLDKIVHDKCDAVDGLKDGQITNPLACNFVPQRDLPICKAGEDKPECFTDEQAAAIARIHAGPSNAEGLLGYGFAYGGEAVPGMWIAPAGGGNGYVIGESPKGKVNAYSSRHYLLTNETLRYVIFNDPNYDLHSFNYDTDLPALEEAHDVVDADNPDLSGFQARGGKLIMGQGWSDWAVGGLEVKNFYDQIVAKMGGQSKTSQFARLFMLPDTGHCLSINPATKTPSSIDYFSALENWVEKGKAPDSIVASHVVGARNGTENMPVTGTVDRTRPICAYPAVATYKGTGNVDAAENFQCKMPKG